MATTVASFQKAVFRFTQNRNSVNDDHTITIIPVWVQFDDEVKILEYSIVYRSTSVEDLRGEYLENKMQLHSWGQVDNYLANVLALIIADSDPISFMQLDLPATQSIVVTPRALSKTLPNVLSLLGTLAQAWPTTSQKSQRSAAPLSVPRVPPAFQAASRYDLSDDDDALYEARHRTTTPIPRHLFFDEEDGRVIREE